MDLFRKHLWKCIMIVFFLVAIIGLLILINPKETVNAGNNGDAVILSKNTIDYNSDLRNEELLLKMTDGRHYEEKEQEPEDIPEDEVQNKSNLNRDSDTDNEQDGKPYNMEGEEVDLDIILDDKPQKKNQIKFETDVKNEEDVIVVKPVQTIKAGPEFMEWAIKEKEESQKLVTGLFETILDITQGDDSVKLDLSLKNISKEDLKFYFSSGQRFDIFITGHEGEEVYRWSHDKCFTMAIIDINLKKGEKLSFLEAWDYLDNEGSRVPAGKYSIKVKLLAKNGKTISPDELTAVKDIDVK